MIRILTAALAIIVLIVAIFAVAIYGLGLDNPGTRTFNRLMPVLPAAMINGQFVLLREVEDRLAMYEHAVNFQSKNAEVDRPRVRQEILAELIEQSIVKVLLRQNDGGESRPEIEEYSRYVSGEFQGDTNEVFGVDEKEFQNNIVVPDLEEKTLRVLLLRKATDSQAYREADRVKILLEQGLAFGEAVKTYSQDEDSKYLGGDLGLFLEDEINPWLKDAVLALSPSSTSDVLVSPDGYHILRVSGRNPGPPEKIGIQHIFIRGSDFQEYLDKQRAAYRVYIFARPKP